MKYKLIGLTGKARSGKDTVAAMILENAMFTTKYSFADPIRAMLKGLGVDMNDPFWIKHKEDPIGPSGFSPRVLMQTLGTEWARALDENFWINLAQAKLDSLEGCMMVVPDVRFENEAAWIRQAGGVVCHITRPDAPTVAAHSSEAGVRYKSGDLCLVNDGTINDLYKLVMRTFFNESKG